MQRRQGTERKKASYLNKNMLLNITKLTSLLLLAILCLLPAFQTAVSVYLEWHTAITYPVLKVIMIIIPVVVWLRSQRSKINIKSWLGLRRTNTLPGWCIGLLMSGVILGSYYMTFRSVIDPSLLVAKIRSLSLLKHYWIMAMVVSLCNSLF